MDADFLSNLGEALQRNSQIHMLGEVEAEALRRRVTQRFGFQASDTWGWEQLRGPVSSYEYGQGDGLTVLRASLPTGARDKYLFLTDDNPPPWVCLQGPGDALIRFLGELRFVECFFVDETLSWILFDTHHNTVVGTGAELRSLKSGG